MKKVLLTNLLAGMLGILSAQDVIFFKNGDRVNCAILEVTEEEVRYEKADYGPVHVKLKSEIFLIQYKDGRKDIFTNVAKTEERGYEMGIEDGKLYRVKAGPCVASAAGAFLFGPAIGLVPPLLCESSPPEMTPDDLSYEYLNNPEYRRGYNASAYRKKKRKVWIFYGVGSSPWVLISLLFLAL